MPRLDIPTLSVICVFLSFTYAFGLLLIQRLQPNIRGINTIALALLLLGVGFLLLSFGNHTSYWISKITANSAIVLSFVLLLHGVCLLRSFPHRLANIGYYGLPMIILGLTYFTYFSPSTNVRIFLVASFIALMCFLTLYANLKGTHKDIPGSKRLLSIAMIIQGGYSLFRVAILPFQQQIQDFMQSGLVHQLAFISLISMVIFIGFSITWLLTGRLVATIYDTSLKDDLTQLYNRRALSELAPKESARARRFQTDLSFVLLDIDRFKEINDFYGHQTGDRVLNSIGRILHVETRANDFCFRYGGEEFLLILPETSLEDAEFVAEKLRQVIERTHLLPKHDEFCTASFGVSSLTMHDTWSEAVSRADQALYEAKKAGRNQVVAR